MHTGYKYDHTHQWSAREPLGKVKIAWLRFIYRE